MSDINIKKMKKSKNQNSFMFRLGHDKAGLMLKLKWNTSMIFALAVMFFAMFMSISCIVDVSGKKKSKCE